MSKQMIVGCMRLKDATLPPMPGTNYDHVCAECGERVIVARSTFDTIGDQDLIFMCLVCMTKPEIQKKITQVMLPGPKAMRELIKHLSDSEIKVPYKKDESQN